MKTFENRVIESVRVLKQMKQYGISDDTAGYAELKHQIDTYVRDGNTWIGIISFPDLKRVAHVSLPKRANKAIEVTLKTKPS